MSVSKLSIIENILNANDQVAKENQKFLNEHQIFALNIMASPGAGKTSLILSTIQRLSKIIQIGVIEGDTTLVTIDSEKVLAAGVPAVQINTGGSCHLDAVMVKQGLQQLPIDRLDMVIIENVGNLVCPAGFRLGQHANIVIASVPEGDDKPYKYPGIYRGIDVLVLNKIDLLPYIDFNMEFFSKGIELLNPGVQIIPLSCKTGEGVDVWIQWLITKTKQL